MLKYGRVHNFNPGPAQLPLKVLEQIRDEFMNLRGTGMSILETSHRSKQFEEIVNSAVERVKRLLKLDDDFHVVFIQGGASFQFFMVPMNLSVQGKPVDYINTGTWSTKAIKEAKILKKDVRVIASSEDKDFSYIPKDVYEDGKAAYLHFTSNNTIRGTQWKKFPDGNGVPLVSDMSSDIMSRVFDPKPFGLIYAGAQKNIGPAGVCLVIIRRDMLERVPEDLPTMLKYTTYVENNSLANTPPCFAIYVIDLVLKWIEEDIGGLEKMEQINREKAKMLYDLIDSTDFYIGTAEKDSRSMMNVTFRLPTKELEELFIKEAQKEGFAGIKGHRSVGGCRVSLYNAVTVESVKELVSFMKEFERRYG